MTTITDDLTTAAVALGRKGGRSTSAAKRTASAANGALGGRPSLRAQAAVRVQRSPRLREHEAYIMADWPEGREHWRWVLTAPIAEILEWVAAGQ